MTTTIQLRNEEVEIEFKDHGWEPDTNAHDIDWEFVDPKYNEWTPLTDSEEQAVMDHLYKLVNESHFYDEDYRD